ncbi:aldose epimerase family protein [Mucilaginibacter psychrotolerans]|uniref:Aldose 1-epimerase n=1 Tax=Mucilaginibacter psychrotolerans TaxID=1524096 RepID=A0A4Y8S7A8_9SPHI|nr:aldose epimerase family protein [Mucilaginibacter psychrotolerans]TFF34460.1 galactose mutarotase [Mucilaginibacter psychrotolerans]
MMNLRNSALILAGLATCIAVSCAGPQSADKSAKDSSTATLSIDTASFDTTINGKSVKLYKLVNKNGASVSITNYGGRIVSLLVPDKSGKLTDVVLGYQNLKDYQKKGEPYFGAIIGRYGNRIANGKFTVAGKAYQADLNDGVNTLHGGSKGFFGQVFTASQNGQTLSLEYTSADGEGGYPGTVSVTVVYTLTDDNALEIAYTAKTDKETILNLTNHAYFNLNGAGDSTILDNVLQINADAFTPVNKTLIPTGELKPVKGTPFDFLTAKTIGKDINVTDEQLANGKGYDHNFVLNKSNATTPVATVSSTKTGIAMEVYTSEPGLQFYSGNFLTGQTHDGKGGAAYPLRSAFCLETQHFPDSPNQPTFPSTLLKPGQTYQTKTTYKFLVK